MRKILFAAFAASVLAVPAFAQVAPTANGAGVGGSAHAGVSATGAPSNTGVGNTANANADADATSSSSLGLGGLLKQTQAGESSPSMDGNAGLTGSSDAKALAKKARAHGH